LDQHIIDKIEEAQDFATQWFWTYNNDRPNMGIGRITPAQKLKMGDYNHSRKFSGFGVKAV